MEHKVTANKTSTTGNNNIPDLGCYALICGKDVHEHLDWINENNPGCWKTYYICLGHCGGHIQPVINLKLNMSYENLAIVDDFKVTGYLHDNDFSSTGIKSKAESTQTIAEWKSYWDSKADDWFEAWFKDTGSKDIFDFNGWYAHDDDGNIIYENGQKQYNNDFYDLPDLYGSWLIPEKFEAGLKNWEEIGEVTFPVKSKSPLKQVAINKVIKSISGFDNFTEDRKAIIKQALGAIGHYWFDDSSYGKDVKSSGRVDEKTFIASIFNNIGLRPNYTNVFNSTGPYFNAGDIISFNLNGKTVYGVVIGKVDNLDAETISSFMIDTSSSSYVEMFNEMIANSLNGNYIAVILDNSQSLEATIYPLFEGVYTIYRQSYN